MPSCVQGSGAKCTGSGVAGHVPAEAKGREARRSIASPRCPTIGEQVRSRCLAAQLGCVGNTLSGIQINCTGECRLLPTPSQRIQFHLRVSPWPAARQAACCTNTQKQANSPRRPPWEARYHRRGFPPVVSSQVFSMYTRLLDRGVLVGGLGPGVWRRGRGERRN